MVAPKPQEARTEGSFRHEALYAWDLSQIRRFMVERKGLKPEMAERVETEYRRFFELTCLYDNIGIVPACRAVDEFWHAHILFTRDYASFCEAVDGQFIHHLPTLGDEAEALIPFYTGTTFPAYEKHFGEKPPEDIWLHSDAICWGEGGGGNCS